MNKTIIAVVAVLVIAGWWFMGNRAVAPTMDTNTQSGDTQSQTIAVSGSEFKYEPSVISAKVGQQVTVTYTNVGQYPHDFVIDELGVQSQVIKAGETGTFSFTPTKAGTFSFYCSLPNHLERGMEGTITVN